MKLNRIFAALAAAAVLAAAAGCTKKQEYSTNDSSSENVPAATLPAEKEIEPPTEPPVVAAEDGPKLSIDHTTAAPGEYAKITLSVKDAENNWQMCGLHITYPNVLKPEIANDEERYVRYSRGEASDYSTASLCMEWRDNMPEELTSNDLGCFFFTEVFTGNTGLDGDIASFKLKIPDDAEPGTVYPVGFYFKDGDMFLNEEKDKSLEKYAFENWQFGSITVE